MNTIQDAAKKLRAKLHPNLHIHSPRPVVKDYGYMKGGLCFEMIEFGTQKADFQIYAESRITTEKVF
jgi:hypothetical protein